ncbi:UxaA family hydrolase [Ponticaulis sp.]|uniref:UxaA family hydrolase n=1 Tax=Ponticaulis sp. TaxID=2020902 RepID=UPI0025EA4CC9|nr:altronate dehydratase family protein [Ponticaulis sp.]
MEPSEQTEAQTAAILRVSAEDHVAVALLPLEAGTDVSTDDGQVTLKSDIPAFHKFALNDIAAGTPVKRFGEVIGNAISDIAAGDHVHSHNIKSNLGGALDYNVAYNGAQRAANTAATRTFKGYKRADGRVGTRNEVWIIPTVGCVSRIADVSARKANANLNGRADSVIALAHPHGCSQLGDDLVSTRDVLASLAGSPNVGGLVLIALGCETNQVDALSEAIKGIPEDRIRIVRSQMVFDEMEEAETAIEELLEITAKDERTDCPISDLVIGLKCGGSDALSGLTANPLLGDITDRVTAVGGKAILTEIPEIFGAEHLLMTRTPDDGVRRQIAELVNDFKDYYTRSGHPVNENPSPGNKAGGITTLEEKSLGAVQKTGKAPVEDVIRYAVPATKPGLSLLEAPGNDAISCTALSASGANIILFTTGRGTPLGFPVPTIKVASNSNLANRKPNWIDFDAGVVLSANDRSEIADALVDKIIAVASGEQTCNERNEERSISIWKKGVTL